MDLNGVPKAALATAGKGSIESAAAAAAGGGGGGGGLTVVQHPFMTIEALALDPLHHRLEHSECTDAAAAAAAHPLPAIEQGQVQDEAWGQGQEYAVCYLCRLKSIPGKFNAKKADELGVPNGKVGSVGRKSV